MSGDLVGLVVRYGPTNRAQWAVLVVVAEEQRGPFKAARLADSTIAERTHLSRTAVKTAVKALRADGWLAGRRGVYRESTSTHALDLTKYPEEQVAEVIHRATRKGSVADPSRDSDLEGKGSVADPSSGERGQYPTRKGSVADPSSVSVTTPVPHAGAGKGSAEDPLPLVVGVRTGRESDDDTTRTALDTFGIAHPSRVLRQRIGEALDRGWTASALNHALRAEVPDVRRCRDVAGVLCGVLASLAAPPAPKPAPARPATPAEHDTPATPAVREAALAKMRNDVGGRRSGEPSALDVLDVAGVVKSAETNGTARRTAAETVAAAGSRAAYDPFRSRRRSS